MDNIYVHYLNGFISNSQYICKYISIKINGFRKCSIDQFQS